MRGAYREKDIVLSVGKYLKEELSGEYDIIMTRDTDKFITLSERPKMGNRTGAKLFVSLHVNAAVNTAANGVEVYFSLRNLLLTRNELPNMKIVSEKNSEKIKLYCTNFRRNCL